MKYMMVRVEDSNTPICCDCSKQTRIYQVTVLSLSKHCVQSRHLDCCWSWLRPADFGAGDHVLIRCPKFESLPSLLGLRTKRS